jgi:hypothetical protein
VKTTVELEQLWRNPRNWHLHFLYFCRNDPRIMVPKRIRWLGCTLNFAHPFAVPFLILLIGVVCAILDLAAPRHAAADVRFDILVLVVAAIVALGYYLWRSGRNSDYRS